MLIGILLIFYMKMTSRGSLLGGWGLDDAPACIPAPPPESLPAIVKTFLTCWWWLSTSMMVLLNGSKGSRFNSQRSLWLFLVICLSQWRWYSCSMTILIGFWDMREMVLVNIWSTPMMIAFKRIQSDRFYWDLKWLVQQLQWLGKAELMWSDCLRIRIVQYSTSFGWSIPQPVGWYERWTKVVTISIREGVWDSLWVSWKGLLWTARQTAIARLGLRKWARWNGLSRRPCRRFFFFFFKWLYLLCDTWP